MKDRGPPKKPLRYEVLKDFMNMLIQNVGYTPV